MSFVLATLRGVLRELRAAATFSCPSPKVSTSRNGVAGEDFLGLRIDDDNLRVQIFFVLDDDHALHAGLVDLFLAW